MSQSIRSGTVKSGTIRIKRLFCWIRRSTAPLLAPEFEAAHKNFTEQSAELKNLYSDIG